MAAREGRVCNFENMSMTNNESGELHWYACKIYHNKMKDFKAQVVSAGFEYYIPMRNAVDNGLYDTEAHARQVPVIPSLIFVRTTEEFVKAVRRDPASHAGVYCTPGTSEPAVIRDSDMETFIFVTSRGLQTMEAISADFAKGDRVRITDGVLKGAEGYIKRVHGTRRFVVTIEGVAAVATTFIPKQFIEKIG